MGRASQASRQREELLIDDGLEPQEDGEKLPADAPRHKAELGAGEPIFDTELIEMIEE